MDTYYNMSDEERRNLYLKAEPHLTMSDYTKIEKELNNISETKKYKLDKISELEKNRIQVPTFLKN